MSFAIEDKLQQIKHVCDRSSRLSENLILDKVVERCTNCLRKCEKSKDHSAEEIKELLKQYSQIVFDFTYSDECKLVEEEFSKDTSKRIHTIFEWLDSIEELIKKCLPHSSMVECLGEEITECFYWRKGALLYMLCNTIYNNDNRMNQRNEDFYMDVKQGICHLQKMLTVRTSDVRWEGDKNASDLANMGVYSDTHLLGMMYAGEMCYWYCQSGREDIEEFKTIGKDMLSNYIQTVKSPLMFGWSTEKAEEYLKSLS